MAVTSRICDRCGAEIKESDWDGKYDYTGYCIRYSHNCTRPTNPIFDLCLSCRDQLHEWFEKYTNK